MSTLDTIFGSDRTQTGESRSEQRVEQLLALNKAAIDITGELELDKLLQRIVDAARELVGCKYAALGVLGDDGFITRFPTSGISQTEREKLGAPPRGHGLLGVMLRAGRSLRIPDIGKDPRRVGFPPHHPPMKALLGVPIFVQGKLVGTIYLTDRYDASDFTEEDEWLVQLLATHAATALTNAGLHEEKVQAFELASRERARSHALFKVTQAVNRSVLIDEVIQLVVQSAASLSGSAAAAVYLLEPVAQDIDPQRAHAIDGASEQAQATRFVARYAIGLDQSFTAEPAQLPVDRSVAGRAVKSGQTQVVGDTSQETDMVFPPLAGESPSSLVAVPLIVGDGYSQDRVMLGVLSTYADRPHAFDEEAVRLLEAFGAVASTALRNASLYKEAQHGREAAEREGERLRELEQMKDEFLSMAAHELRTPLTTIKMSAGLALEQLKHLAALDEIDPRVVDLMALVVEGTDRMHSLVNDLLDLTRLEQGRITLHITELDLRDVLAASAHATKPLFDSKGQELAVRLPEVKCKVKGDEQRLEQGMTNLLSNAHKYSPRGSRVEIRAGRSGAECLVTVRDDGPGVPPEEQERIFERFYRSNMHRNDRTASTGLGLPIARTIAEMHGGRLWCESAPGGGSLFTLALPIAD